MLELTIHQKTLENGGETYNFSLGGSLGGQKYYAVAMYPQCEKVVDKDDFTLQTIREYVHDNAELLKDRRNSLGTWLDTETNKVYIDISRTIQDYSRAVELGIEYNQLAIFNLETFEEIRLDSHKEVV